MKTLLILISTFLIMGNAYSLTGKEVYRKSIPAILYLQDNVGWSGTGFFAGPDGLVFTNHHVIEAVLVNKALQFPKAAPLKKARTEILKKLKWAKNNKKESRVLKFKKTLELIDYKISNLACNSLKRDITNTPLRGALKGTSENDNKYKEFFLVDYDCEKDFALLKVSSIQKNDGHLMFSKSAAEVGEKAYVIGHPEKFNFVFTDGIISKVGKIDNKSNFSELLYTIPTLKGTSGGPVINQDGNIIGINKAGTWSNHISVFNFRKKEWERSTNQNYNQGTAHVYLKQMYDNYYKNGKTQKGLNLIAISNSTIKFNSINDDSKIYGFELKNFPFPKELNMRMYSISGGVYEYVGNSADGKHDIQVRYSKKAGTDAQFSDWNAVNKFVASENKSLEKNGSVVTYPIVDSSVFHVKSTVTMKNGKKVKYLRIFPGSDVRIDLMVYSKDGSFDKINVVVNKFMNKLRGNQAFAHLYKGKRNISNI